MEQNEKTGANSPGYRDRKMGNIGTASESNPVTAHGIFNSNALKNKCRGMSDYELEGLLDYIYARRNVKALNIIGRFMEDRGLLEKIDNGHYRRTY